MIGRGEHFDLIKVGHFGPPLGNVLAITPLQTLQARRLPGSE